MDGTNRIVLHDQHLSWPNALTIDYPTQTLYWADAKLHIIESSDIHGARRRPVLTSGILHPFALSVFEDLLYWSDWNTRSIVSTVKRAGGNVSNGTLQEQQLSQNITAVHMNLFYPMDLHVLHPVLQYPLVNPCGENIGGCEYMCLLSSENQAGYTCSCPTGIKLMPDGKQCSGM